MQFYFTVLVHKQKFWVKQEAVNLVQVIKSVDGSSAEPESNSEPEPESLSEPEPESEPESNSEPEPEGIIYQEFFRWWIRPTLKSN